MTSDREQGLVAGLVQHVGPLLTRERWALAGLVVLAVPTGLVEAVVVALVAEVAVTMAAGSSRVVAELGPLSVEMAVSRALFVGLALAAARLVLRVGMAYLPARIVANAQARLRRELFEDFVRAGWATQAQERDGHLQEVMTTQVNRIARLLWQAAQGLGALLVFLGLAVSAFLVSPVAAGAMLLVGAALFGLLRPLAGVARAQSTAASGASVDLAAAVNEAVRVGEEHHVFGTGRAQSAEVEGRVEEVRRPFLRALFASRAAGNSYQGLVFILLVAGLAGLRLAGVGDLAAVGATVLILLRSLSYGQEAQTAYTTVNDNLPYLRRAVDAHERYREALEPDGSEPLENVESLRFDQVSYAYDRDEDALQDVSFSLASGEAVGIIGPSGAGKSTLVQILLRLRRPDTGRYTINDLPVHRYARDDWTQRVSYVPQEPKLIHGTVADNIRFYRDGISDAAVEEAARAAHIHAEVTMWPEGYARLVGQRANAVSGGQRQRLCLARALVTRPQLLVLDEPTSALDPRSERLVQRTLRELHGEGVMLCIVAHRSVTLELVDRVLVLEEGRRVAFGPPGEVAADGGELISELLAGSGVTVPRQQ